MARIRVVDPQGRRGTIPEFALERALSEGFRLLDEEEKKEVSQREGYEEQDLRSFAEGAARGATFGLSDQALVKLFGVDPEGLRMREELNPYAAGGGEIAGVLGSFLVPGAAAAKGAGLFTKGIRGATALPRAVQQASTGIAKKLVGQSIKKKTLNKAAVNTLTAAIEGAAYGGGEIVSEEALSGGDYQRTAEEIVSHIGTSALVGGAFGAGVELIRPAGRLLAKASRPAREALRAPREALEGEAKESALRAAFGRQKRAFTQLSRKELTDDAAEFLNKEIIAVGDATEDIAEKVVAKRQSLEKEIDSILSKLDDATAPRITRKEVANELQKKVAMPLKDIDEAEPVYNAIVDRVEKLKKKSAQKLTFREAAEQRRAIQNNRNYNIDSNQLDQAMKKYARIWNDVIDKEAEAVFKNLGESPTLYKDIRRKLSLAYEIEKFTADRALGNMAVRRLSPTSQLIGSAAGAGSLSGGGSGAQSTMRGLAAAGVNQLLLGRGNATLAKTADRLSKQQSLMRFIANSAEKTERAVKRVVSSLEKGTPPAAVLAMSPGDFSFASPGTRIARAKEDIPDDPYRRRLQELQDIINDPKILTRNISKTAGRFHDVAPKISTNMAITAMRGAKFLYDKAPKPPDYSGSWDAIQRTEKWKPSDRQVDKWMRYVEAVEKPLEAIRKATPEAAEAIQAVYPKLYDSLRQRIGYELTQKRDSLPYQDVVRLSSVLGAPMDITLQPSFVRAMQAKWMPAPAQSQAPKPNKSKSSAEPLEITKMFKTRAQQLDNL